MCPLPVLPVTATPAAAYGADDMQNSLGKRLINGGVLSTMPHNKGVGCVQAENPL